LVRGGAMAVPAVIVFTFFAGLFALDGVWLLKRRGYMSFVTSRWEYHKRLVAYSCFR
jgi:hypothetical protein